MIFARLNATTGLLSDIRYGPENFPDDVPLAAMPNGPFGTRYTYDAATQRAVVAAPSLAEVKASAIAAIDARTLVLLAEGFSYTVQDGGGASNFGLDAPSVANWTGMVIAAAGLPYPFAIADVAGNLRYLQSAADTQSFFSAGVSRSAAIQQAGIALKVQINACTTTDQVAAVVDNRS
jgi:hypothetical protein